MTTMQVSHPHTPTIKKGDLHIPNKRKEHGNFKPFEMKQTDVTEQIKLKANYIKTLHH